MKPPLWLAAAWLSLLAACTGTPAIHRADAPEVGRPAATALRVATYNVSLYDDAAGGLIQKLQSDNPEVRKIAAVIQHVRPDVLLLNEFDFDPQGTALALFKSRYLAVGQYGQAAIDYPYAYSASVNTGVPSGLDLDNDGTVGGTGRSRGNDAWGYGLHPGQYGMLVLSRYPIDVSKARSFQFLTWASMPNAMQPIDPRTGKSWYKPEIWNQLRLSSKSHWDLPITVEGKTFHFLVSHPTPPVFDGPEKRNRNRNHDEIRLWGEYIGDNPDTARWLCDDKGQCGGLPYGAAYVIAGDQNADPIDGDGVPGAINQILRHPTAQVGNLPQSAGALERATFYGKPRQGELSAHTGDFGSNSGTLRLDYVIPSQQFKIAKQGVFWPASGEASADFADASDHHMVWMDLTF